MVALLTKVKKICKLNLLSVSTALLNFVSLLFEVELHVVFLNGIFQYFSTID